MRRMFPRLAIGALAIVWALSPPNAHAQFIYPVPYPYPYGGYWHGPESDLRIEVTPKEAGVYVDGYFAGTVDEFNGTFQRLHVLPGEHEIVIYLDGYRSIRERLYLSPHATRKIVGMLNHLAPGTRRSRRRGRPNHRCRAEAMPAPPPDPGPGAAARPRDAHGATLMIRGTAVRRRRPYRR